MDLVRIGRLLRLLRIRRDWRLADVAARTGLSITAIHRHERGVIDSLRRLERHGQALELRFDLRPIGRGADVTRTLDAEHAAIENLLADAFLRVAARVQLEVSFNEWGERGRIDLLAGHAERVFVCEVKTELADLQDLFGSIDRKMRLAPAIASRLDMDGRVTCLLAVASTARNRSIVRQHAALFASFQRRRFTGVIPTDADRILLWVPPGATGRKRWLAGQRRVQSR